MWSGHCRPLVLAGRSSAPGHLAGRRCPRHQTCVALFESGAEPQTNWSFTASCMATRAKAGPPAEGDPPLAALYSEGGVRAGGARGLSSRLTAPDCVGPPRFNSGTVYPLQASLPPSRCRSACTVPPTGQHFTHAPVTPVQRPPPHPVFLPPALGPAQPLQPFPLLQGLFPSRGLSFLPRGLALARGVPGTIVRVRSPPRSSAGPTRGKGRCGCQSSAPRHPANGPASPPRRGTASAGTERKDAGALRPAGAQTGTEHDSTPTVVFVKSDHVTALLKTF